MVVSSRRLYKLSDGASRFIKLRLVRIVPLYWISTAAKLVSVVTVPSMALHTHPTPWNIIASFLFPPSHDAAGAIRPVVDVGWTLSFEMLFYVAFAASIFFTLDPLVVVAPAMVALAALSLCVPPDWPAFTTLANPMVLEFVFGLIIGRALLREQPRRAWARCRRGKVGAWMGQRAPRS